MGKVIAIVNQKGGVGKTTTTVNLSANVALLGKKVLIIDNDPQGNTTSGYGVDKASLKKTIYDVLINRDNIKDAVLDTMIEGLKIIPSSITLAGAEIELVSMMSRETILKRAISVIKSDYDYIFIDCPPSLGLLTLNALTAADSIIIPIQCEYYALEGLTQLLNTIDIVRNHLNTDLVIEGVVLTMFDGRTNLSVQVVQEVKKHFRDKIFSTIIPRNVRLGEAPSYGVPIMLYDDKCVGAITYKDLAEELVYED